MELEPLDLHRRSAEKPFEYRLYFDLDSPDDDELAGVLDNDAFFFDFVWEMGTGPKVVNHSAAELVHFNRANRFLQVLGLPHFTHTVRPEQFQKNLKSRGNEIFKHFQLSVPPAYLIPEFRRIQPGEEYTFDGENLIGLLADYQVPDIGNDSDQEKFNHIRSFLRQLLHLPDAELEVYQRSKLILNNDGLRLPLENYGTGVHELVIMLTAVLSKENVIFCIEEPEIHLHPRLQREFVDFLAQETSNRYLISTHSPTLINLEGDVQVFHLIADGNGTRGRPVLEEEEALIALADLGVKASDLLQSNCVIWVEGPSDRIYLRKWIELLNSDLCEGRDYSIMPYGGASLAHMSVGQNKVPEELISILRINQHAIVVMDSDRTQKGDRLAPRKLRVRQECERNSHLCWITDGREIENYLPPRVVSAAIKEVLGKDVSFRGHRYGRFERRLASAVRRAGSKPFDYARAKPQYSRVLARHFLLADMDTMLRRWMQRIVEQLVIWAE